jgi:hypothetical protein
MDELKSSGKPFVISKWKYGKPIANRGAPGVDAVILEAFEKDPQKNLYSRRIRRTSGRGSVVVDPTPCCGRAAAGNDAWRPRHRGDQTCRIRMVAWTRGWGPPFVEPET